MATTTTFVLTAPPASGARRTPSGNWILQATPTDEKFPITDLTELPAAEPAPAYQRPTSKTLTPSELEKALPEYCHEADEPNEPDTIAKKLFIFGFMFPPLWLIGTFILCIPLRVYPIEGLTEAATAAATMPPVTVESLSEKIPTPILEKEWTAELLALHGRAERHWAWRCMWALIALILVAVTIVCAALGTQLI